MAYTMMNREILRRYVAAFGHTFTVSYWSQRPGVRINELMTAALDNHGPVVTDQLIADELATRPWATSDSSSDPDDFG